MDALALFDAELQPLVADRPSAVRATPATRAPVPRRRAPHGPLLLAVDGNSLAHRAFHAYGAAGLGHGTGGERGALYGFLALLSALHDKAGPDAVVVGFDCRVASVRKQAHPAYKANRPAKDPALHALLDLLPPLLADLGVEVVSHRAWEADDVVGSAASAAEAAGWRCLVATSDRDAFGLVSDATAVLRLRSGLDNAVVVDRAALAREVGVAPEQYVELSALRGDVSDNLPGVPGIGPARAAALLSAFPSVADAVADPLGCRSVLGPALGQALLDDVANPAASVYLRNVELMTIKRDLPVDLAACRPRMRPAALAAALEAWSLGGLAGRVAVAFAARPDAPPPPGDADLPS